MTLRMQAALQPTIPPGIHSTVHPAVHLAVHLAVHPEVQLGLHIESRHQPLPQAQAASNERPATMRVSLICIDREVNIWLRFGRPMRVLVMDSVKRVAVFAPGTVCCRAKWIGSDGGTADYGTADNGTSVYGTAVWQLMVLQAAVPLDGKAGDVQRLAGVVPGARILLRAEGERQVKAVFAAIDALEAAGVDPCAVPVTFWRTVGNRLAARQPLPEYTAERHAAHVARKILR
jgi:hypothetical protein